MGTTKLKKWMRNYPQAIWHAQQKTVEMYSDANTFL